MSVIFVSHCTIELGLLSARATDLSVHSTSLEASAFSVFGHVTMLSSCARLINSLASSSSVTSEG